MLKIDLANYQFVRVSGADTIQFLQGQLSCNMDLLAPERSLRGALCNLKGRVIADFRVLQQGADCLLQTSPAMAQPLIDTLSKYAVFSKVELTVAEPLPRAIGVLGENPEDLLHGLFGELPADDDQVVQSATASLIKIAGASSRYEIWSHVDDATAELTPKLDSVAIGKFEDWVREDILAGIVHISPKQSEAYTPQLLNYDISGVIDFDKGCYTGQEVVARMYYRGTPKKRLFLLSSNSEFSDTSEVIHTAGDLQKREQLIAVSNSYQTQSSANFALAILSTKAVANEASFSLSDRPDGSLKILPLPYVE